MVEASCRRGSRRGRRSRPRRGRAGAPRPRPRPAPRKPRSAPCCGLVGLDVLGGRGRAVGVARRQQPLEDLLVARRCATTCEIGPSSQSSSSQRSASRICSTFSGVERSRSVSSMRRTSVPPACRGEQPVVERRARAADVQRRRSGRERSGPSCRRTLRNADRRPRLPRRRPGQGRRARRRARRAVDPDLQPEPARVEADASTATTQVAAFHEAHGGAARSTRC